MSAGFTPEPWEIWHDDCAACAKQGNGNWFVDGPLNTEHGGFANEADARLIAAAPELYAALAAMVADHAAIQCKPWPPYDSAVAALAKARGEQ